MKEKPKPIEVVYKDFTDTLAQVINSSGLPACIVEQALRSVLAEVSMVAAENYQRALAEYNKPEENKEEEADG